MKHRPLIASLASFALLFNASGIAMALAPAAAHASPPSSIDASIAAHCAGNAVDSSLPDPRSCCEYGQCVCVLHATMGTVPVVGPVPLRTEGPAPGSGGIAASPPIDDPLRPPIA